MNSLKIQYIALSMMMLLSGIKVSASHLDGGVPGQDINQTGIVEQSPSVQVTPPHIEVTPGKVEIKPEAPITDNTTAPKLGLWAKTKGFFSKENLSSAKKSVTEKSKALANSAATKMTSGKTWVKAHPYRAAGYTLGTIATTAAVVYGGLKLNNAKNNINERSEARIIQLLNSKEITPLKVQEINNLINGMWTLPGYKKQLRAFVTEKLNKTTFPVAVAVKNTVVDEAVQAGQNAANAVAQVAKSAVNSVEAELDALITDVVKVYTDVKSRNDALNKIDAFFTKHNITDQSLLQEFVRGVKSRTSVELKKAVQKIKAAFTLVAKA